MNQLKFRAWTGHEMMFKDLCDRNWYSNSSDKAKLMFAAMPNDLRRFKIMQFTGLKDNKDREIYEGDVVNDFNNKTTSIIKFECGIFLLGNKDYVDHFLPIHEFANTDGFCEELEVEGDIYRCPEMIEGILK